MYRSLAIASALLFTVPLSAQPPESRLAKSVVSYREFLTNEYRNAIDSAKKSRQTKDAAGYTKRLRLLEKSPLSVPILFPGRLRLGDIGYLRGGLTGASDDVANFYQVRYVMDDATFVAWRGQSMIVDELTRSIPQPEVHLIISGISTAGLTDDKFVRLPQIFEVADTAKYAGMTAFKLRPFEIQNPSAILARLNASKR